MTRLNREWNVGVRVPGHSTFDFIIFYDGNVTTVCKCFAVIMYIHKLLNSRSDQSKVSFANQNPSLRLPVVLHESQ
jgi:hypothetical protein